MAGLAKAPAKAVGVCFPATKTTTSIVAPTPKSAKGAPAATRVVLAVTVRGLLADVGPNIRPGTLKTTGRADALAGIGEKNVVVSVIVGGAVPEAVEGSFATNCQVDRSDKGPRLSAVFFVVNIGEKNARIPFLVAVQGITTANSRETVHAYAAITKAVTVETVEELSIVRQAIKQGSPFPSVPCVFGRRVCYRSRCLNEGEQNFTISI